MKRLLLGVDEAGRGPLAGPVAVGVVAVPPTFDFNLIEGVRDSKQMSELGREIWFEKLRVLAEERVLRYTVVFSSARMIDIRGIAPAVRAAIARALWQLEIKPEEASILLDGALRAPRHYIYQKTIIGGDEQEPLIALASIAAKVKRDRLMRRLSLRYPEYGFDIHKGYGTKKHREAIINNGLCDIHRRTFCRVDEVTKKA
jgi:ribonuclease HII